MLYPCASSSPILVHGSLTGAQAPVAADTRQLNPQPYSTVTDFARLRGWSTSVPLSTAT